MRIDDKVSQLIQALEELESILPKTFEQYLDIKTKAACERYFERSLRCRLTLPYL